MAGADGYDVVVPHLIAGAADLYERSEELSRAGGAGAEAAAGAGPACGEGPLAEALAAFADAVRTGTRTVVTVTEDAGDTLRANAFTYDTADGGAAGGFSGVAFPTGGPAGP